MELAIGIMLTMVGLGMIGFWVHHIVSGGMPQGIRTLESGGFIIFHITVELITGLFCILGGLTLALCIDCGPPVALFASGMLAYTGINSLAWKEVRDKPLLALMFIVPAVIAIISGAYLVISILT